MKTTVRSALVFSALFLAALSGRAQTVVWSENFDDGNGNNRWFADNGVWQIGSPAIGPETNSLGYRTHAGPYCATTGLTANYPAGANSRLIRLQTFTVPASNQFPRLRFWQWYSFAGNCNFDYGVVEVRVGTNAWQAVSPHYTGSGGDWTYASVDLSAYAGQTVQVAFHMVYQSCGSGPGWYVDDLALVTGTPVFNNPESFEGGLGDWYAEAGTWQVGIPTKPGGAPTNALGFQTHGGSNCAVTLLNGNYPGGVNSRLISPAFTVPAASSSPYLRFWQWYSFAGNCNFDYGVVEVRVGTNAWQAVSPQYTGNSGGWTEPAVDLSAYGGQSVQVAFHMVYQSCGSGPGWYVDDTSIQSFGQPVILVAPAGQTNVVGTTATLDVSASGDSPLSYQWRFNSNAIAGATSTLLTLTNLQLTNTGYYDVVVTNSSGSITSTPPALVQVIIAFTGNDVGNPGAPGSFTSSNGVYAVTGSGEDIEGTADDFFFAHQSLSGDCQIVARVLNLQSSVGAAEAGIMIRESLNAGSKHVFLRVNAGTNAVFRRRLASDAPSVETTFVGTNYSWLRLMRMGNTLAAHSSTNGTNWQYVWFTTINMSNQVQVGLAVTAHNFGSVATATFDNVSIGSLSPLPGVWLLAGPKILLGGDGMGAAELQRVGGFKVLIGGAVGDYVNIKGSPNLRLPFAAWTGLGTVTNAYGVVPFMDNQVFTNGTRFYRAQKVGP